MYTTTALDGTAYVSSGDTKGFYAEDRTFLDITKEVLAPEMTRCVVDLLRSTKYLVDLKLLDYLDG